MKKRIALAVSVLVGGLLWAAAPLSQASPGGGGCVLQGTASFNPGLTATDSGNFKYSFSGALNPCDSDPSQSNPPSSGAVSAGKIIKVAGARYQEPIPTGTGSCASGSTKGIALVVWNDKTQTVISYTTQSATGGVFFGGTQNQAFATVIPSVKLKKVGAVGSYTFKTTRYKGGGGIGSLTVSPNPDPTACNTGVKSAGITGFVGIGSSS